MKAAVLYAPGDIRVEEVDLPQIKDNEVLIKVYSCGICGTDVHVFNGERKVEFPLIQGHEIAGKIVEIGKNVNRNLLNRRITIEPNFNCGECYFCRIGRNNLCLKKQTLGVTISGGFCEYINIPQKFIWPIPDKITYDEGALIEALTVGFHAVQKAEAKLGHKIIIFGLGVIGLSAVQFARQSGAQVCAVDLIDERLQLAKELGADVVFNATKEGKELNDRINEWGNGYINSAIEAAGVPRVQEQALNLIMPGGRLVLVGQSERPMQFTSFFATRKEIEIVGSIACLLDFPIVISLIDRGIIKAKHLITHKFKLDQLKDAYGTIENLEALKVVIHCQE